MNIIKNQYFRIFLGFIYTIKYVRLDDIRGPKEDRINRFLKLSVVKAIGSDSSTTRTSWVEKVEIFSFTIFTNRRHDYSRQISKILLIFVTCSCSMQIGE